GEQQTNHHRDQGEPNGKHEAPHRSSSAADFSRLTSTTLTPCRGRNVNDGHGVTSCPGTRSSRNRWPIVASTRVASIRAKDRPMHTRGPPPKGKKANLGSRCASPSAQRSGSNWSGRWK